MTDTRIHPETGKTLRRDVRSQTVTVGALSQAVDAPLEPQAFDAFQNALDNPPTPGPKLRALMSRKPGWQA